MKKLLVYFIVLILVVGGGYYAITLTNDDFTAKEEHAGASTQPSDLPDDNQEADATDNNDLSDQNDTATPPSKDIITTKRETIRTQPTPYQTEYVDTDTLFKGETQVRVYGVDGYTEEVYEVTYKNGTETKRILVEKNIYHPANQVIERGTKEPVDPNSEVMKTLTLVNELRLAQGLNALTWDKNLEQATAKRAKEIVSLFDHNRPDGSKFSSAIPNRNNYGLVGENLAKGHLDAAMVIQGWKDSPGHYENMIHPDYTSYALSLYYEDNVAYWVQIFGVKK